MSLMELLLCTAGAVYLTDKLFRLIDKIEEAHK